MEDYLADEVDLTDEQIELVIRSNVCGSLVFEVLRLDERSSTRLLPGVYY